MLLKEGKIRIRNKTINKKVSTKYQNKHQIVLKHCYTKKKHTKETKKQREQAKQTKIKRQNRVKKRAI